MRSVRTAALLVAVISLDSVAKGQTPPPPPTSVPPRSLARLSLDKTKAEISERVYQIKCRIYDRDAAGKETDLSRPTVMTIENQAATVQIGQAVPVVFGASTTVQKDAKPTMSPRLAVLQNGLKLVFVVTPDRQGHVALDMSIAMTNIKSVKVEKAADGQPRQAARSQTQSTRYLECVELGKKLSFALDEAEGKKPGRMAEITIVEATPTMQGTPVKPG